VTHGARIGDWILILDADETFDEPKKVSEYILKADVQGCDALGFRLYDMWDNEHYREDEFWQAHKAYWPFAVKFSDLDYFWKETPLHCGRFPMNTVVKVAGCPVKIQHWGWTRGREEKYERYLKADPQGRIGIMEQYKSILDPSPTLRRFNDV
jgi:hypothetical protein